MTIDRSAPVPIYYQLKRIIQAHIEQGILQPGDRLPTEQELCEQYGISRSPVRHALNELTYEGVITRRPALGTFVAAQPAAEHQTETPIHTIGTDTRWMTLLRRAAVVWNAEHPDRPLRLETEVIAHGNLYARLNAAVGDGTAPDVGMLDCVWIAEFAQAGYLFPLEALDAAWSRQAYAADLYAASREANTFAGQLYGVQFEADVSLLWYRKDWFEQEGLVAPADWEALLKVARHFKRPEVAARYGIGSAALAFPGGPVGGEATVYSLMPFIWSAGGKVFDEGTVALDSHATHEALAFLRGLVRESLVPADVTAFTWDAAPRLFAGGKVPMALGGSYEVNAMIEWADWDREAFCRHVGCTPIPAAPRREPAVTLGGMSCGIFRQSRHPELAMGLLETAMRPDLMLDFCRLTWQQTPRVSFARYFGATAEAFLSHTARMLALARARPALPEYAKVSRQIQHMIEAVLTTDRAIPEIVARTSEFISVISDVPCHTK
ncbi:MAG: extracellular solute-binding protein [Anaerolineae bacterium]|nr:extracellular solute-binding protein [Anaerolineae bacterium]